MFRIRSSSRPLGESSKPLILIVEQDQFLEVSADLLCKPLKLLDELRPAKVLSNDHVMTRAEMHPRRGQCSHAGEQPGRLGVRPPAAKKRAHSVDIWVQGQRMVIDVPLRHRRLAASRWAIQCSSQSPVRARFPWIQGVLCSEPAGSRWTPLDNGGPMAAAGDLLDWVGENIFADDISEAEARNLFPAAFCH